MANATAAEVLPAIEAVTVTKRFGSITALDGVSLTVPAGTLAALLGHNGAGKTTLVRIIATLTRPDAGQVRVLGVDVAAHPHLVRGMIGLTGQYVGLDEALSGQDNLLLIGRLVGLGRRAARSRAEELAGAFGLTPAMSRVVRTYSGGMRRRLDLAASLMARPALLILDEPTTGLDPASRRQLWTVLAGLRAAGTTMLLTTQYLEEADSFADHVHVLSGGVVVASGTAAELKAQAGQQVAEVRLADPSATAEVAGWLAGQLPGLAAGLRSEPQAGLLTVPAEGPATLLAVARAADGRDHGDRPGAAPAVPRRGVPRAGGWRGRGGMKAGGSAAVTGGGGGVIGVAAQPRHRLLRDSALMTGRQLLVLRRSPGRLLYPLVQPVVLLVLFVSVFGNLALGRAAGGSYRQFLVPGILIQNVALTAPVTGLALLRDSGSGLADRFRSLPMAHAAVLAGRLASDAAIFAAQAVLVLGVGALLGFRAQTGIAGLAGAVAVAVVFGVALAVTCCWLALLIGDAETAERVLFFPFIAAAFISSAYVPASLLAGWLQPVARASPVTAAAGLARSLTSGGATAVPLASLLCWVAVLAVVPGVLTVRRWLSPA